MRRAFSLIELLVVISIIAVLSGLTITTYNVLSAQARVQRTNAMLTALANAVTLAGQSRGGAIAPAEHPLAGSAPPRSIFLRAASGNAVAVSGTAYRGVTLDRLVSAQVLLDDDVVGDVAMPMLYGASRQQLGVLGVPQLGITHYRLLPHGPGLISQPDTVGRLVAPQSTPADSRQLIQHIFGSGGPWDALINLKAVWSSPDADSDSSNLIVDQRVWSATQAGKNVPGTTTVGVAGVSHRYRLRGLGFYDAWGNEIFYRLLPGDRVQFLSAGRDGHLRWHPGPDGVFATAAIASTASGDDRDARADNLSSSEEAP